MALQRSLLQKLTKNDKLLFTFSESVVIKKARRFILCVAASVFIRKKSATGFLIAALLFLTFNEFHLLAVYTI